MKRPARTCWSRTFFLIARVETEQISCKQLAPVIPEKRRIVPHRVMIFSRFRRGCFPPELSKYHYLHAHEFCKQFILCDLLAARPNGRTLVDSDVWLAICCYILLDTYARGYLQQTDKS